ncbi:ABC transporter ATP-binding protein [Streptomyces sp. GD-15H]|uniref:ABC transporter ATP-binding protein n=1 Tax=Streptomyces sp. GD-15H TaxID=3129112 RepID=UPI00324D6309
MVADFAGPEPVHLSNWARFLLWLIVSQLRRTLTGAVLGSLWMLGLSVPPYLLSRAIDDGLKAGSGRALLGWVAVLCVVGLGNAALGIARHRTMTMVRMDASFRIVRAVVRQSTRLGATLTRRSSTGEVMAIGMADVQAISQSLTVTGPGIGAVVAYVVVALLLFAISPLLAAVILLGVPLLAVTVGPLLHRMQEAGMSYREQQGALTARLVDVIGGLRVLNGLGGKQACADHYHRESGALRTEGYRVAAITSWVGALGVGLPALFLAVVTWLAARMAAQGSITIGDLIAVYGYAAMLIVPVSFFIEGGSDLARASVAARQVIAFLRLEPEQGADPRTAPAAPTAPAVLHDPVSGVEVRPGLLTALAGSRPADGAAVLDRLGLLTDSAVTWGGVRLDELPREQVRERILVADNEAYLFAGAVREVVAGRHEPNDVAVRAAIHTAVADDIVEALPERLDAAVTGQGGNFSGGQRQRLRLARALYAEPEVLLAAEPTSAVDAHTEALMAERVRDARQRRTTVITTTSPLILELADVVVHLVDGKAAGSGTHRELLRTDADYRVLVTRGSEEERG